MKRTILFAVISCLLMPVCAQEASSLSDSPEKKSVFVPITQYWKEHNIFQHLDASVTLGTTGIGIEASSPISDFGKLRAGFSFMPHFHYNMSFPVQVGETAEESATKFENLSGKLKDLTGFNVDDRIDMIGVPTYFNFNLLFDFFPIKNNKHWYVTAGFYLGNSKIAEAYNTTEDMPSLMAISIYNNIYNKVVKGEPIYGTAHLDFETEDKILSYGRMGVHVGDFENGDPYMMEPDENSMVKARATVNAFKPYLGFGYTGRLIKGNDDYKISFDCGALFWGGTPSIITHDGTNLSKDVKNIQGKVGDYIDLFKSFKVFPVLNVKITKTIF